MNLDIPTHKYKPSDLTIKEAQCLLRQYSCTLCQHNGHPLHEYSSVPRVYDIKLKSPSTTNQSSRPSFLPSSTNNSASITPISTNRVSNRLVTIEDTVEGYVDFENELTPPLTNINDTDYTNSNSSRNKISKQPSPYPTVSY